MTYQFLTVKLDLSELYLLLTWISNEIAQEASTSWICAWEPKVDGMKVKVKGL